MDFIKLDAVIEEANKRLEGLNTHVTEDDAAMYVDDVLGQIRGMEQFDKITYEIPISGNRQGISIPSGLIGIQDILVDGEEFVEVKDLDENFSRKYLLNKGKIYLDGDMNLADRILIIKAVSYPLDEETGFPLIPDKRDYINACSAYIAERLAFREMVKRKLERGIYEYFRKDRFVLMERAKTNTKIPSNKPQMRRALSVRKHMEGYKDFSYPSSSTRNTGGVDTSINIKDLNDI